MTASVAWSLAPSLLVASAVGYLCGSIPFGLVVTRLAGTDDIRTLGSGNIGATNVLRTGRRELAAATLAGDMLKGTVAVLAINAIWGRDAAMVAALGAFLGHLLPVWARFRGGKGVATYLGVLAALSPFPGAVAFAALWLAVAYLTRYSSLAALLACAATPAVLWAVGDHRAAMLFCLLSVLIFVTHRANIVRLIAGTEGKIGAKAAVPSQH
jgi:acyl phosphate:glycerol-3-phosphate acyltransferase